MQVYDYRDYKAYVNDVIRARPNHGRGERARLAEALHCHIAYVSQVLNGAAHFSPEQADLANRHFAHGEDESDFFLLLVLAARAGTRALREYYDRKVTRALEKRDTLKHRLEYRNELPGVKQSIYYSQWYYAAIHLLIGVPGFSTRDRLAERLGVSRTKVAAALDFLVETGLARQKGHRYEPAVTNVHLGNDSLMIARHHTNWRLQAIAALEREQKESLHYSSVVTVSERDVPTIRKELVAAIERVRAIVKASPEETLYCYTVDLFTLGS